MKQNIALWQFFQFVAISLFGILFHFLFNWFQTTFTAVFSAVNESTWEHMKLFFFPAFMFSMVQYYFIGKDFNNFWCIKLRGTIIGLVLIPILFYTLQGVFGTYPDWINIAIFFVSLAFTSIYELQKFYKDNISCKSNKFAFIALCLIAVSFAVFTFAPPEIPIFQNPIDGSFGIPLI